MDPQHIGGCIDMMRILRPAVCRLVRIVFIMAIFNFIHSMSAWNCRQRQQPEHDLIGHCLSIEAPSRLR
jgi:hypothetical protein